MNAKTLLGWLLVLVGLVIFFICPMAHWVKNPELSQMQVLMEYWAEILGGIVLVAIGTWVAGIYDR